MIDPNTLPLGIRNLNPGNLRSGYGLSHSVEKVNGYAKFNSMREGVQAMATLAYDFYDLHGLKTLDAFVGRWAPATENDVAQYIRFMSIRLQINPLKVRTQDIRIDEPWPALDFLRAISVIECGRPPHEWAAYPEWISPSLFVEAMQDAGKWPTI